MDKHQFCCNRDTFHIWLNQFNKEEGHFWKVNKWIYWLDNSLSIITNFSLGVVGRFSSEEDEKEFEVPKDSVFWFPTDAGDDYAWFGKMLPALKTALL